MPTHTLVNLDGSMVEITLDAAFHPHTVKFTNAAGHSTNLLDPDACPLVDVPDTPPPPDHIAALARHARRLEYMRVYRRRLARRRKIIRGRLASRREP